MPFFHGDFSWRCEAFNFGIILGWFIQRFFRFSPVKLLKSAYLSVSIFLNSPLITQKMDAKNLKMGKDYTIKKILTLGLSWFIEILEILSCT